MHDPSTDRRDFLRVAAGATLLFWGSSSRGDDGPSGPVKIREPFHGAVLNRRHGKQTDRGLEIAVRGDVATAGRVTVNGIPARRSGGQFEADVVLTEKEPELTAVCQGDAGRHEDRVRVVWDRLSRPRYRFSIDDNSFFLRDVYQKQYKSLFDCFYMKMLRDLHAAYGVKYTVNIYYTTGPDFNLSQFPDRYKSEWRDNADWLRLAFHAYANDPPRPYFDAEPEKLIADLDLVAGEIHRFAGEEAYAPPTVIHFAECRHEAFLPLVSRGVRVLSGYFAKQGDTWPVCYRWNDEVCSHLSQHDAWKDFQSGIVFSHVDIVLNSVPAERVLPTLDPQLANPNTAEIIDLFTHEQYFWPFYHNYLPDHPKRLDIALRWVTEHGFQPVFFHEGFLGGAEG